MQAWRPCEYEAARRSPSETVLQETFNGLAYELTLKELVRTPAQSPCDHCARLWVALRALCLFKE